MTAHRRDHARVQLATRAMATRFEIVIRGMDPVRARAAGEEALEEIRRIERQLSWFRPESLISRINQRAFHEPVLVHAPVFKLLQLAQQIHADSCGAFDPTVVPGQDGLPIAGRKAPGMGTVHLDPGHRSVRFDSPETALNLGGIGKGYALDEAAALLGEAGVEHALLHGGTSTAVALGQDDHGPWRLALSHPAPDRADEIIAWCHLEGTALSASSIFGRGVRRGPDWIGHVLDPRTGKAVSDTQLAAILTYSIGGYPATRADALSTALLVLGSTQKAPDAFEANPAVTFTQSGISYIAPPWMAGAPTHPVS